MTLQRMLPGRLPSRGRPHALCLPSGLTDASSMHERRNRTKRRGWAGVLTESCRFATEEGPCSLTGAARQPVPWLHMGLGEDTSLAKGTVSDKGPCRLE